MTRPTTLLERARRQGTPLVDGDKVTFVWRGRQAPALLADFGDWEEIPFQLEPVGKGLWIYQTQLPRDAYVEYAYLNLESQERIRDPFNSRAVPNGYGEYNQYFYMPEGNPSSLIRRRGSFPKGKVSTHRISTEQFIVGRTRNVYLYRPPVDQQTPLLMVYDGQDYLRRAKLPQIVDNLIHQGRIAPISMVMIAHGGKARIVEYACSEATLAFVENLVLPLARRELTLFDLDTNPGSYAVLGASMGGVMAMFTGLRWPDVFSRVLSQSGAFGVVHKNYVVQDLIRYCPAQPLEIWMDVGELEGLLSANRKIYESLMDRNYRVTYREYAGGHNYTSWRNDIWRGLEHFFPARSV